MNPVLVIPIQIPYHLYVQFKAIVDDIPDEALKEWNDWRLENYRDGNGKLPLVQYYLGSTVVPDLYGYVYTSWLALQELRKHQ